MIIVRCCVRDFIFCCVKVNENNEMFLYIVLYFLRRNICIFFIFLLRDFNLLVMGVNDLLKCCLLMRYWILLFVDGVLLLLVVMIVNIFFVFD